MVIGVSGKIGSGKDTVGKMLQYLLTRPDMALSTFRLLSIEEQEYKWQIKKFSDKLKDIVCILIGCTREQLEDHEFKNRPLGEEWIRYSYAHGFTKDNDGNITMLTTPCDKETYLIQSRINWQTAYKFIHTPRTLMQLLGTECGRNIIHPDIWVNSLFKDYYSSYKNNPAYKDKGVYGVSEEFEITNPQMYPNWIITDVRFVNEAIRAVKERGILIRVNSIFEDPKNQITRVDFENKHQSEDDLDEYKFDYYIENNDSIDDLYNKVKDLYLKIKNDV
jgi:hypothetical protein